ncbi:MAG: cation transporter [Undibacterium sp.]|nr:cation transporter [Undibacterium sp.]
MTTLHIGGLRCAACVQLIEFSVRQMEGIQFFRINPLSQKAELRWQEDLISLKQILLSISKLGYSAFPSAFALGDFQEKEKKRALWRLFVAGFAMMQVMMYAFPAYLVPEAMVNGDLTPDLDRLLKFASLCLTLPVMFFSAVPFFKGAWRDLAQRHVGMDVPVALGIVLTFCASVWASIFGGAVYFDSVIMFVFLLLGARYIEENVKQRTLSALQVLSQIRPSFAQKILH